jgi:NADP-dependent 3-hydroxy acid dehydrogenase YdfG
MEGTALITGASSGIGMATAKTFAHKGLKLLLCGRRTDRLQALELELSPLTQVEILVFDIQDFQQVSHAWESLEEPWKQVDVLVNNAGNAHGLAPFHEGQVADWDAMIDANVQGLLYISRLVIPGMVNRKRGHLVNISSVAGKYTYANGAVYCASKKAVEAISEGMRLDLTQYGIKVTNIAPGAVETEFSLVRFKGDTQKAQQVYQGFTPLRPEDIADAIAYAVSAPAHVTIADMVIYPAAQAAPSIIYKFHP